jgi:prevent-host-death family protein
MKCTPVSELKATLSEHLARVKAGEEVIVMERGKPIAKIVPLPREASASSPHLMELTRAGLVRLGSGKLPPGFWKMPRHKDRQGATRKALLQERAEAR